MILRILQINKTTFEEKEKKMLDLVSKERQIKVKSLRFPEDKNLSLYAEILIMKEIAEQLNKDFKKIKIQNRKNIRPFCNECTDANWDFNISHTRNAILFGFSKTSKIGVDIEKNENPPYQVMPLVFHPSEIKYICESTNKKTKSLRFFKIWTRKEAYSKYTGLGLYENLKSLNTLDFPFCSNFKSWKTGTYICSVFCNELSAPQSLIDFKIYTEEDF